MNSESLARVAKRLLITQKNHDSPYRYPFLEIIFPELQLIGTSNKFPFLLSMHLDICINLSKKRMVLIYSMSVMSLAILKFYT